MTDDKYREAFERHFADCNLRRINTGRSDCYESTNTAALWEGWQAAMRYRDEKEGKV